MALFGARIADRPFLPVPLTCYILTLVAQISTEAACRSICISISLHLSIYKGADRLVEVVVRRIAAV